MVLGNKCDLDDSRVVTKERGSMLANEHGIKFYETSAKSGLNVEEAFITLARDIKDKMDKPVSNFHVLFLVCYQKLYIVL